MKVTEKFLTAINGFALHSGVVVALSGGADSVCLLSLFASAKQNGLFKYPVVAAHLNHCLRGEEADRDEEFCRELCLRFEIPFFSSRADVNALARQKKKSIEEAARDARYLFLENVVKADSALGYIATAHNKDDLCETVLLNMVRGSGIDGLCSIPRIRDNIIRPLLDVSRSEILAYNEENGLCFVTDSSNLADDYSRNKLRHSVMPVLGDISSGYLDCISRAARLLSRDAEFLNGEAQKAYLQTVSDGCLYTKKAQNLHPSVLSRIIKMLYNDSGFSGLTEAHIEAVCEQIALGNENFSLSMHGCIALCERGLLRFGDAVAFPEFDIALEIEKEVMLPSGITLLLSKNRSDGAVPILAEALSGKLSVRSRREGDSIKMLGKTHKIKRIISDKKLNSFEKSRLFFLTADGEIIYSNLPAVSDKAFTKKDGENCIYISTKETI